MHHRSLTTVCCYVVTAVETLTTAAATAAMPHGATRFQERRNRLGLCTHETSRDYELTTVARHYADKGALKIMRSILRRHHLPQLTRTARDTETLLLAKYRLLNT